MQNPKAKSVRLDDETSFETGNAIVIDNGTHRGTITEVYAELSGEQQYPYLQLVVNEPKSGANLRYGCPLPSDGKPITPASKLGKLLLAFGHAVPRDEPYTVKEFKGYFTNQEVEFLTWNEESKKNPSQSFAVIQEGTLQPPKKVAPKAAKK